MKQGEIGGSHMKWQVQEHVGGGWTNTWTEVIDGKAEPVPLVFDTEQDANDSLDDLLAEVKEAVSKGEMDATYNREDYRIVPVNQGRKA